MLCERLVWKLRDAWGNLQQQYEDHPRIVVTVSAWAVLVVLDGITMAAVVVCLFLRWGDDRPLVLAEEVASQVMCGLFLLQALALQPLRFVYLYLCLCDSARLERLRGGPQLNRCAYFLVLLLLNLNCWFRYVMVYFMWTFAHNPTARPVEGEFGCMVASLASAVIGKGLEGYLIKNATEGINEVRSVGGEPWVTVGDSASFLEAQERRIAKGPTEQVHQLAAESACETSQGGPRTSGPRAL